MPRKSGYRYSKPGAKSKPGKNLISKAPSHSKRRRVGGPAPKPSAKPKVIDH